MKQKLNKSDGFYDWKIEYHAITPFRINSAVGSNLTMEIRNKNISGLTGQCKIIDQHNSAFHCYWQGKE